MRNLSEKEWEQLSAAGKICYDEIMQDIEKISLDDEPPDYDREKIRQAEAAAWQEVRQAESKARNKRLAMLAACLLLALTAIMLTGKPSVAYQKFWNNLFVKDNGTSMSISSSSTALLPENWSGCYLPMEIPPGYAIESTESDEFGQSIFYVNADGNYIDFSVNLGDFNVHLDKENCTLEEMKIGNTDGLLRTKYKNDEIICVSISWIDNDVFFDVSADNLSSETLLSIAESIMIAE